jgi:hypothetical protein
LFVNVAAEDELSEAIAVRLVSAACGPDRIGHRLGRRGNSYLVGKMSSFRQMAIREPIFILTDLDDTVCAPSLIQNWRGSHDFPENLLLRVAVREAETWLLADKIGTADLLGVSPAKIPNDPENINDPKSFLLNLARQAKRDVRSELIISKGAIASQGLGYNRILSKFAATDWDFDAAAHRSGSLAKASMRLAELASRLPPQ